MFQLQFNIFMMNPLPPPSESYKTVINTAKKRRRKKKLKNVHKSNRIEKKNRIEKTTICSSPLVPLPMVPILCEN